MNAKPRNVTQGAAQPDPRPEGAPGFAVPDGSVRLGGLQRVNARREVICLALAAAEVCWVAPAVMALIWVRAPHLPLLLWVGILILMLGFFYLYRALVAANLPLPLQQGLLVLGLLFSIGLMLRFHVYPGFRVPGTDQVLWPFRQLADVAEAMPITWMTGMILIFLWARAVHLANRSLFAGSIGFSFRSGVIILVALAFFVKVLTDLDVSGFVVPYFFFALVAMALARIEEVSLLPNSSPVSFSGFWIGSTMTAVAVLVLLGMGVGLFFYGGGLGQVLGWLSPVWLVLQIIFVGLGTLILMLFDWILALFSIDLSALGRRLAEAFERLSQLLVSQPPLVPPGAEEQTQPLILRILQVTITVGIPLAIISLVLLLTWRRLRRGRLEEKGAEARESLLSAQAVARNLQAMLQDGLDRLGELAGLMRRFGPGSRFLAAISIRRIYANLVRLATEAGYPRARAQTPYEYLQMLHRALPGSEEDVAVITEAYVNAHYGQVPDDREELQRIRDCWERVRTRETAKSKQKSG